MSTQFKCTFCGYPVDPKSESTAELVTAWVTKARVIQTDSQTWRYAHKVCVETEWDKPKPADTQIAMF
jgi:hypothetical protein